MIRWRKVLETGVVALAVLFCLLMSVKNYLISEYAVQASAEIVATESVSTRTSTTTRHIYVFEARDGNRYSGSFKQNPERKGFVKIWYVPQNPQINDMTTGSFAMGLAVFYLLVALVLVFLGWKLDIGSWFKAPAASGGDEGDSDAPRSRLSVAEFGLSVLLGAAGILFYMGAGSEDWFRLRHTPVSAETDQVVALGAPGNRFGNLAVGGDMALADGWLYFRKADPPGLMRRRAGASEPAVRVLDGEPRYVNVVGGRLYYLERARGDDHYVWSAKTDGGRARKLFTQRAEYVLVCGNWIFFASGGRGRELFRARTDGTDIRRLTEEETRYIQSDGSRLYYITPTEDPWTGPIVSIANNGDDRRVIGEGTTNVILVDGDRIYYSNTADGGNVWAMGLDGRDPVRLCALGPEFDKKIVALHRMGDWLIIRAYGSGSLYRCPVAGGDLERLIRDEAMNVHVFDEGLYYYKSIFARDDWYFIGPDGGPPKKADL